MLEITQIKAKHRAEIELIKLQITDNCYKEAEKLFQEKEAVAFQKFDNEKVEIYKQLKNAEQLNQNFNKILVQHLLNGAVSSFSICLCNFMQ